MKEENYKAAIVEILHAAEENNEKLLKAIKGLVGDATGTPSKGRLILTNTQTSEERVIVVNYDNCRALLERLEQALLELWTVSVEYLAEQVKVEASEWELKLQTERFYRVTNKLAAESKLEGYSIYRNERLYHFVLSRREAEFFAQQLRERNPEAKIEIREEEK